MSNQLWLRRSIWHWKNLFKEYKIDPSNVQIEVHLRKLWVFEVFWHPMMRLAHKLVITISSYLRVINISKGGSFYKVLKGDLEESRGGVWMVGEGIDS
jgi:hypothetical protein